MRSLESRPPVTPVETGSDEKLEDALPVWQPSLKRPRPPPLPSLARGAPKTISAKQYRELSLLKLAGKRSEDAEKSSDIVPVAKSIGRTMGVSASESDGAVTSRVAAQQQHQKNQEREQSHRQGADIEKGEESEELDLESILEEALMEDAEQKPPPPPDLHRSVEALGVQTTASIQEVDLTGLEEKGTKTREVVAAVLKLLGYASWEALASHIRESVAVATASQPAGQRQRYGSSRTSMDIIRVADVLNSKSAVYHAAFKESYGKINKELQRQAKAKQKAAKLEEHSALVRQWSSLTATEHAWYLQREGHKLSGSDAERFETLKARIEAERRKYWDLTHAAARQEKKVYDYAADRQIGQIQADRKHRIQRRMALPQFYTLHSLIRLPAVLITGAHSAQGLMQPHVPWSKLGMLWVKSLHKGHALKLGQLKPESELSNTKYYLPAVVSSGKEALTVGGGGLFRKRDVVEPWEDASLLELASHEASGGGAAAAGAGAGTGAACTAAAGAVTCLLSTGMLQNQRAWEIPVTVLEASSGGQKVIFLGKPLLARTERMRDKQRRLQKYAALSAALEAGGGTTENFQGEVVRRDSAYDLWYVGTNRIPLIIRSHGTVHVTVTPSGAVESDHPIVGCIPSIFALKTDYIPPPDLEDYAAEELVAWWCKLLLNVGAEAAVVATVDVPHSKVKEWSVLREAHLLSLLGNVDPRDGFKTLHVVLEGLQELDPGKYVMVHGHDMSEISVFRQTVIAPGDAKQTTPLPISGTDTKSLPGEVYDLYAVNEHAGEIDITADAYIQPRWRPYRQDVAQIPYTFPIHTAGGGKLERGRHRRRKRGHDWSGDMDQVHHVAMISREEYKAELENAL